jgi:IclR family transcriptional regulator, acetate operon repressor
MTAKNTLVRNAFAILQAFRRADEQLSCIELSRRARLPRASGHRLIRTLEEIGALSKTANGRYCLGILLSSLSRNVEVGNLLRDVGTQIMRDLATKLNVTVHIGILEDDMVTYVAKESLPTSFAVRTSVGAQLEPYCSGLGKVLLAALPRESLDSFLSSGSLVALTSRTITKAAALRTELKKVRVQGFAIDDGECLENMYCVAAPIRDVYGHKIAALSATDDALSMSDGRQLKLLCGVLAAASEISLRISSESQHWRSHSGHAHLPVLGNHQDRFPSPSVEAL